MDADLVVAVAPAGVQASRKLEGQLALTSQRFKEVSRELDIQKNIRPESKRATMPDPKDVTVGVDD